MDAGTLRCLQAPLKERYRSDPEQARMRLLARGRVGADEITCVVDGWSGPVRAGLHPATGGTGEDACSGDMLLQALVACAGVTLRSVATAMGLTVRSAHLRAEATFDVRGTLGVDRTVPVGVQDIVLTIELDTDADDVMLQRLAASAERYCVVGQSLQARPRFVVHRALASADP
ncbi:MAG: OsmC family protein [Dermatophilaceae bacterium]